jgi:hypothetical protein
LHGKTIETGRVTESKLLRKGEQIDTWYAAKTHDFRSLIQALMDPRWVWRVLPCSVHDITAARELVLAALAPYVNDLTIPPDGGYESGGHAVHTPVKRPRGGAGSTWRPERTTASCERCGVWANAAPPSWSHVGKHSTASP